MNIGVTVTWREAVTVLKNGRRVVAGERVITGTIARVRTSRGGTTDYKIDVEKVEGYRPTGVKSSIWVLHRTLSKGRRWQKSCTKSSKPTR